MEDDVIYLSRDFINWRWFHNAKITHVYLWLLLSANYCNRYYGNDMIRRGSIATTNETIAESCGLTIQNVRTALANLEKTGEIKRERRNRYQIIAITNYESFKNI